MPPTGWNMVACQSMMSSVSMPCQRSASSSACMGSGSRGTPTCGPGAGQHFVAGALRAGEFAVGFEVAIFGEELEHALLVLGAELLIERALADALRRAARRRGRACR